MTINKIIQENSGTIIDVSTPNEFMGGHVTGAINIPLLDIPNKMEKIKFMKTPFILCCASGARSEQAQVYLSQQGFECYDAGSWLKLNNIYNNK